MAAEAGLASARLALGWLVRGETRAHPTRFLLTALAIAVGVALGFAVHLVNASALQAFDGAVRGVNGAADLAVRASSPLGFDEALYPVIAQTEGVAGASPVVSLDATIGATRVTLLGLDAFRAMAVTPSLVGVADDIDTRSESPFAPDALYLSRAVLSDLGTGVGERVTVDANGRQVEMRVRGVLPGVAEGQRIGTLDIAAAQWLFDRLGRLDRIDLRLGNDPNGTRDRIAAQLPGDASLGGADEEAAQGNALSRAYRVNLDMLALVALVTGGFLVFSAQSLSVARRLRVFALIRTLGLPRGGVIAAVAAEGLVIGLVGSLVGLLGGWGLAVALLRWFGGDLGAGYFRDGAAGVAFQPAAALVFLLLGLAAALLGSILPARAASRAAPAAALKNTGDALDPRRSPPLAPALWLLGGGTALAFLPAVNGLPIFGFAAMALILAGGVAGVPWLLRRLLAPLLRRPPRAAPALLALRHVHGAPGEAATALCGIVASTALMIAMATMVTSFRVAVDDWLGDVLRADLYLRVESGAGFDSALQARLRAVPGVAAIDFSRQLPLSIRPGQPPVVLIARPVASEPATSLALISEAPATGDATPIWVSEPASRIYDWKLGQRITLPIGGATAFTVAGVWRDYARQQGAIAVRIEDYERLSGDGRRDEAAVTLQVGADVGRTGDALRGALGPELARSVSIAEPATLRRFALDLFDRSFAVTYLLEAVAILVGLAGVAATVSSQTVARIREFGMLRHIGVAPRQIVAMLGLEGALLGLVGALAGVLLGLGLSQVLIHVVNPQSFNWTMTTRVPIGTIVAVVAALALAATVTAMVAARRATARDAVLAVREDW
ncbi:ABC transporter permease [Aureimonas jatrophae]|uniref:Putative ABC transport system permease protein n=1 Tax=Aureimonas jatrophae TaxID=1166073 RepID=A0A1H0N7C2_9HYPH|nr:FtsX-like permease family protein [Aureimonas jatrophae]MBB3951593.1 putative ABC transport system permease protein [Aureimonas jatrophae]SDO88521.1 putative ABC transport system permease protein [Aureimonas jatrophae]